MFEGSDFDVWMSLHKGWNGNRETVEELGPTRKGNRKVRLHDTYRQFDGFDDYDTVHLIWTIVVNTDGTIRRCKKETIVNPLLVGDFLAYTERTVEK